MEVTLRFGFWFVHPVAGGARPTCPRRFKVGQAVPAIVGEKPKSWCVPQLGQVTLFSKVSLRSSMADDSANRISS